MRGLVESIKSGHLEHARLMVLGPVLRDVEIGIAGEYIANAEVILLSRNTRREQTQRTTRPGVHREPLDYRDTPDTRRCRDDMRKLNTFLSRADIDFVDDGNEPREVVGDLTHLTTPEGRPQFTASSARA